MASEIAIPKLPGLSGFSSNNFFPKSVKDDGLELHLAQMTASLVFYKVFGQN
jgi:hypothetical protein